MRTAPARIAASTAVLALAGLLAAMGTASAGAESRVYFHGPRSEHVVALTFDDGDPAANCAAIGKILRDNSVAATFFPSAEWVRRAPSIFKRLAADFPFGDHTATHPHMKDLSYAQQFDEIDSDRRIVEGITGVPLIPFFRAPYGEFDSTTLAAAAAAGFPNTMEWDVNVYDLTTASDANLTDQATAGGDGSVITMHCSDAAVRILPAVIESYRSRGFGFVTVPELLEKATPSDAAGNPAATPSSAGIAGAAGRPSTPSISDLVRSMLVLVILVFVGAAVLTRLPPPGSRSARSPLARR